MNLTWLVPVKGTLIPDITIFAQLTEILIIRIPAGQISQPDYLMTKNPDRADPPLLIPVVAQRFIHTNIFTTNPGIFFDGFDCCNQQGNGSGGIDRSFSD